MKNHAKFCGQYQKSVLSAKNNFNLYVTSVLFAAVFIEVSEVKLSGRSYVAESSSRIAYNGSQVYLVADLNARNFQIDNNLNK